MTVLRAARLRGPRRPAAPAGGAMPLLDHLSELRRRLFVSLAAIAVGLALGYAFFPEIFHAIKAPYCDLPRSKRAVGPGGECRLYAFGILDQFKVRLQIGLYAGILGSSPIWLYQLWAFVTPGLHRHERRWAVTFVASSVVLFAAGVAVAYVTLAKGLDFLLGAGGSGIQTLPSVTTYLSYFTAMVFIFGLSFEFPLVLMMLNATGLVSGARMRSWWRQMIFAITVFAAIATPSQDPWTMMAMAVPLYLLYGLCVLLARVVDRRRAARQAAAEAEIAAQLARIDAASP